MACKPTPTYEELKTRIEELEKEAVMREETERVLRKSEERYRTIFNYLPLGIVHLDAAGLIVDCNEAFLEILGLRKEKAIGLNLAESMADEKMRAAVAAGLAGKTGYYEGEYLSATGSRTTPVRAQYSRITSEDGRVRGAVGLFEDMTEQRQSEEYLLRISNLISDPIYVVDSQHRYVLANDAMCALAGRDREKILGRTDYDFFPKEQVEVFFEKDELVFRTGEENENEEEITDSKGNRRTVIAKKTLYVDRHGNRLIVGIIRDITGRKRAELELMAAHRQLEDIIEFLPDATLVIDREKRVIAWNRAMEEMTSVKKSEILGRGDYAYAIPFYGERRPILIDMVAGDEPEHIKRRYDFVKRAGGKVFGEVFIPEAHNGRGAYLWGTAAPLFASDGGVTGFIQSIRDISDIKKAEQKLRLSEERFRVIFESAEDCIFLKDRSLKFVLVNPAIERLFGVSASQIIGIGAREFFGEDLGKTAEESDKEVFAGETVTREITMRIRNQDRTFHLVKVPIRDQTGEIIGICGISRDITGRKQAEDKLKNALNLLQILIDTIPAPIYYKKSDGTYLGCNKAFAALLRRDREFIIGRSASDPVFADSATKQNEADALEDLLSRDSGVGAFETSLLSADGSRHDVIFSKSQFSEAHGEAGTVGVIFDITDLKRAEQNLKTSENRFQMMAESIQDVFWMGTPDFEKIFYVNPAFEKIWGRNRQDIYGVPQFFIDCVHPDDRERILSEMDRLKEGAGTFDAEYRIMQPDGSVRWVSNRASPVRNELGEPYLITGVATDITEKKKTEEELLKSESELRFLSSNLLTAQESERKKLAAELHDSLGSSLTAVKISIENTLNKMAEGKADVTLLGKAISMTRNAIEEIRRITMDLRPTILDDLGLIETVGWFCRQFRELYPGISIDGKIKVEEKRIPEPLKIVIFRLLQEAFHNIGKYSMADSVELSLCRRAGFLELGIKDNGMGFDVASALSKESCSRGFGLTSMKERTELSGGAFSILSRIGEGTEIKASWRTDAEPDDACPDPRLL